ncbi:MAG: MarR family winged helix-turn-helix transcriptional regulator [Chloroflexota bacterium]|nr:MarR family winged helix-turn-helix transcriptional regulator [Chloroflexota bacterium]
MILDLEARQRARCAEIAATCAGFNLRRASRAVSQHFDRALAPAGLRMTQFTLLAAYALGGSPSLGELAEALVTDRTTLSRNLKVIRAAGLIEAAPTADRRAQRYRLTEHGRAVLEAALPLWQVAQAEVVDPLGADRWRGMLSDLNDLVGVVRGSPDESAAPDA